MRWLVLCLVVGVWAWSEQTPRKAVVLSPPASMVNDVQAAMEIWNQRCPGMFVLGVGGVTFQTVASLPAGHVGETYRGSVRVIQQPYLVWTLAHELGHTASLGHGSGGIMNAYVNGEHALQASDIANARSHGWDCR